MDYKERKYTAIIDEYQYAEKPSGQTHSIVNRISNAGNQLYTLDEIALCMGRGQSIAPFKFESYRSGKIKGKKNEYFVGTNLVLLDIDGKLTIEEMEELHESIGIKPNLMYKSFSCTERHHKYRVVYCLPYMVNTVEEYRLIWDTLDKFYKNCTILDRTFDVSRLYYGSSSKPKLYTYEPLDIAAVADHVGTLISQSNGEVQIRPTEVIDPEVYEKLKSITDTEMLKSQIIKDFEEGKLNNKGDYHKVRSLMFVYHHLGRIDRFYQLAPLNKSKYPVEKWQKDLKSDLLAGRTGHTHTYQILKDIGAFDLVNLEKNKDIIKSNYLHERLKRLQCKKELGIKVEKYLPIEKVKEIINVAYDGGMVLLIAGTGTGKTWTVINALKSLQKKAVISVPNRMNAQQNAQIYNIAGAFAGHPMAKALTADKIVSAVWESIIGDYDYHEHILVNDEAHAHVHDSSFRGKSIRGVHNVMPKFKGVLDITATPTGLNLEQYTHIYEFVAPETIEYDTNVYVGYNETERLNIISKATGRVIWLENKKKNLAYYQTLLNQIGRTEIVTSDDKDSNPVYQEIAENERLLEDTKFLLCTSVLTAGVNILNEDITDIVIVGIKNVTTIKQFIARARASKKINVHIFLTDLRKDYYTYNIFEERENEALILERRAYEVENNLDRDLLDSEESMRHCKLQRNSLEIEEDYQLLDEEIWRRYFNHLSIQNFVLALEEFFSDVEVFDKKYQPDLTAKEFRDSLEVDEEVDLIQVSKIIHNYDTNPIDAISLALGYFEELPRGKMLKAYKKLKRLYPDAKAKKVVKQEIDSKEDKIIEETMKTYGGLRAYGLNHELSSKIISKEINESSIKAKITLLMYQKEKNRWKRNSPAFIYCETIFDRLPKNQKISKEVMREICGIIDGREYKETDRYSNTVKEIKKVIPIKRLRSTEEYQIGELDFRGIDVDTINMCIKSRTEDSLDARVRKSSEISGKWLELSEKFKKLNCNKTKVE